ncbi:MAG: carnitine-CoA ligase [Methylobacteriaceae bacterium]|nr:carnitine-CoA ligase [Methylobacteriaceae bacterium]
MIPPADSAISPYAGFDIAQLLRLRAATRSDHAFLIWAPFDGDGARLTYAQFDHCVRRCAAGMNARGIKPGEPVLIHLENCAEMLIAWFACAYVGAIAVTTNARASAEELAYFAGHSGAVAAITQPRLAEIVNASSRDLNWIALIEHDNGVPVSGSNAPAPGDSFAALLGDAALAPRLSPDPTRPVGVQYTSGTTSRPKGVLWTHANALWGAQVNALHEDLRAEDVHLIFLPLFHTNALAYSLLATLWAGATAVLMPRFSASRFWDTALKHRCTWTSLVPFCVKALMGLERPERHHFRLWGSAICSPPSDAVFGVKTIGWWGMTETMTHGTIGSVHLPNRPMSMGRPAPEYGIFVERDDGTSVEPGETGHLLVRGIPGLSLFHSYLHDPEATAASYDARGLFRTGDRVTLHSDGFLQFADRDKDMLKVGGENVAASEIERVVMEVPGVREVAVVGKPHAMLDEVPIVFVIPDAREIVAAPDDLKHAILQACRSRLASFKVPDEVRVVEDMPRATIEKISKAALRASLRS